MIRREFFATPLLLTKVTGRPMQVTWSSLPPLPRGLGGLFVGAVGGQVVVAGGSWWEGEPWSGGSKHWSDVILALGPKGWSPKGTLPSPMAYGSAISAPSGMILIGGQSDRRALRTVLRLNAQWKLERLTELPSDAGWTAAALHENHLYLAGGATGWPAAEIAITTFRRLRLDPLATQWETLEPWPGPARFLAVITATSRGLVLAGGSDLVDGRRAFLKDSYLYEPGKAWVKLPDLPYPAQAGLAITVGDEPLLFGGSDGALAEKESELRARHPGFRREILRYSFEDRKWSMAGRLPASLVTTGIVAHDGGFVIAGGEDRPGHRSADVFKGVFQ